VVGGVTVFSGKVRASADPLPDPVQTVGMWFHLIRGSMQRGTDVLREVM
jgi:hypothetical protein